MIIKDTTKESECCCTCAYNSRTGEVKDIKCFCEVDGHYIGYVDCFVSVCGLYIERKAKDQE